METTIWKQMRYPFTRYSISNAGQIRDDKTGKIKKTYPTGGNENSRYYTVSIYNEDFKRYTFVYLHREVAKYFLPEAPPQHIIHHIDCNPENNSADNLRWVTKRENTELRRKGISRKVKIDKALSFSIFILAKRGAPVPRLAEAFDLMYFTVYKISNYVAENNQMYQMFGDQVKVTREILNKHIVNSEVFEKEIAKYLD